MSLKLWLSRETKAIYIQSRETISLFFIERNGCCERMAKWLFGGHIGRGKQCKEEEKWWEGQEFCKVWRRERSEREEKLFNPTTKYFVEVVNSFDEHDLYRTWVKVRLNCLISFSLSLTRSTCFFEILIKKWQKTSFNLCSLPLSSTLFFYSIF